MYRKRKIKNNVGRRQFSRRVKDNVANIMGEVFSHDNNSNNMINSISETTNKRLLSNKQSNENLKIINISSCKTDPRLNGPYPLSDIQHSSHQTDCSNDLEIVNATLGDIEVLKDIAIEDNSVGMGFNL